MNGGSQERGGDGRKLNDVKLWHALTGKRNLGTLCL